MLNTCFLSEKLNPLTNYLPRINIQEQDLLIKVLSSKILNEIKERKPKTETVNEIFQFLNDFPDCIERSPVKDNLKYSLSSINLRPYFKSFLQETFLYNPPAPISPMSPKDRRDNSLAPKTDSICMDFPKENLCATTFFETAKLFLEEDVKESLKYYFFAIKQGFSRNEACINYICEVIELSKENPDTKDQLLTELILILNGQVSCNCQGYVKAIKTLREYYCNKVSDVHPLVTHILAFKQKQGTSDQLIQKLAELQIVSNQTTLATEILEAYTKIKPDSFVSLYELLADIYIIAEKWDEAFQTLTNGSVRPSNRLPLTNKKFNLFYALCYRSIYKSKTDYEKKLNFLVSIISHYTTSVHTQQKPYYLFFVAKYLFIQKKTSETDEILSTILFDLLLATQNETVFFDKRLWFREAESLATQIQDRHFLVKALEQCPENKDNTQKIFFLSRLCLYKEIAGASTEDLIRSYEKLIREKLNDSAFYLRQYFYFLSRRQEFSIIEEKIGDHLSSISDSPLKYFIVDFFKTLDQEDLAMKLLNEILICKNKDGVAFGLKASFHLNPLSKFYDLYQAQECLEKAEGFTPQFSDTYTYKYHLSLITQKTNSSNELKLNLHFEGHRLIQNSNPENPNILKHERVENSKSLMRRYYNEVQSVYSCASAEKALEKARELFPELTDNELYNLFSSPNRITLHNIGKIMPSLSPREQMSEILRI